MGHHETKAVLVGMRSIVNKRKDNRVCLHKKENLLVQINGKYGVGCRLDQGTQQSNRGSSLFLSFQSFPTVLSPRLPDS